MFEQGVLQKTKLSFLSWDSFKFRNETVKTDIILGLI